MTVGYSGQKLFPRDKNYILKEAQHQTSFRLLKILRDSVIDLYFEIYNPLRLRDDTTIAIETNSEAPVENLLPFYYELAGIYRYKFGKNQLEFLFDGSSHFEKYSREWEETFFDWTRELGRHKPFIRAVLEATVLTHENMRVELIHQRLKWMVAQVFDVKVYKFKGVQELKVA
jgi:hypothetical protein